MIGIIITTSMCFPCSSILLVCLHNDLFPESVLPVYDSARTTVHAIASIPQRSGRRDLTNQRLPIFFVSTIIFCLMIMASLAVL